MTATPLEDLERLAEQLRTFDPTLDVRIVPVDDEARLQSEATPTHELVLGSTGPGSYTVNPIHSSGTEDRFALHWVGVDFMPGDGDLIADGLRLGDIARAARTHEAPDARGVTGPERSAGRHAQALADLGSSSAGRRRPTARTEPARPAVATIPTRTPNR